MSGPFDSDTKRAIRLALARNAYERDIVRIRDGELAGWDWLVASPQGLFAVADGGFKLVQHGWFFGIHRSGDHIYLFENCGMRDDSVARGRIVRLRLADKRLSEPAVLVRNLHNNCHQLAVIDDAICVVDTANQAIRRFHLDGACLDIRQILPPASTSDVSGGYRHINSIAAVGERIGIVFHNGKLRPETCSEIAWFDRAWREIARQPLDGRSCHDIVEDENGVLWHTDSLAGDLISSAGHRIHVTSDLMARGIAFGPQSLIVGASTFGPRHIRDRLRGAVVLFDRDFKRLAQVELPGAPTDIIAI